MYRKNKKITFRSFFHKIHPFFTLGPRFSSEIPLRSAKLINITREAIFGFGVFCIEDEHFFLDLEGFFIKISEISNFITIFNSFVLRAELELDKKLRHYDYLLLEKRWFPVSFVS